MIKKSIYFLLLSIGIVNSAYCQTEYWNAKVYTISEALKANPEDVYRIDDQSRGIKSIPSEIGKLVNLKWLNLYKNEIETLPKEIGNLSNLEYLNLSNNKIKELPTEIGKLTKLTKIVLSNNQLSSIPPEIGQLDNIKDLFLDHNQLSSLPAEIGNLKNMEWLKLENNKLTHLPEEFENFTNMIFLSLEENQLTHLPTGFGKLKNLRSLSLCNYQGSINDLNGENPSNTCNRQLSFDEIFPHLKKFTELNRFLYSENAFTGEELKILEAWLKSHHINEYPELD